ncbi:hypothetical protein [Streptomyces sp. NPDC005799]
MEITGDAVPPLAALRRWASTYGPEMIANQVIHDQRAQDASGVTAD